MSSRGVQVGVYGDAGDVMVQPPPCCEELLRTIFFFNNTATTEIYTLSLHDALPISGGLIDGIARVWRRRDWSLVGWVRGQDPGPDARQIGRAHV